jgi:hypothetical protein
MSRDRRRRALRTLDRKLSLELVERHRLDRLLYSLCIDSLNPFMLMAW